MRVFWRSSYSCLTPELVRVVKHYDQVYIAGVFTNISVFVSALDVFDRNIPVAVVSDCVATLHGDEVNSTALKSLDFALGKKGLVKSSQIS